MFEHGKPSQVCARYISSDGGSDSDQAELVRGSSSKFTCIIGTLLYVNLCCINPGIIPASKSTNAQKACTRAQSYGQERTALGGALTSAACDVRYNKYQARSSEVHFDTS